uniref:Uncharacterized protein n=2 Tax=Gloeothece TaxID=28070 RepID=E0UD33_GLOV7|nr:hypothetical protein Cyan7822_0898 [Gloeothece verrucosa PCC 7822]
MLTRNEFVPKPQSSDANQDTYLCTKYALEIKPPSLSPREFCRKMFGLDGLPEVEILRAEMQQGYRKQCIALFVRVLGVKRQTIFNWGKGIDFNDMPPIHQRFLGICYERYELMAEVKRLRRFSA